MKFLIRVSYDSKKKAEAIPRYSLVAFKINSKTIRIGMVWKMDSNDGSVKVQAYSGMHPTLLQKLGFNDNNFLTIASSNYEKVKQFD
ncbi:MAG: hypothetical protein HXX08_06655 [Chloroflexi bacterium]|uniref:Uncharacterized protein n=1 Tax=Candidatus Chlorohelix allophototropha TaxID=3003348 RepID=A0A8T7M0V0_9CHLR|nr:hypothetical protein [Chloroflexota bacterium]WJW67413.1 hypothetical protein OZ401_000679 [Chloroflexota bacterium L227-S17]